ncbi:MAG: heparan-alpha-glucosaminide N-acetyltransferase domain-containing protein [Halioglobus sp.]
MTNIDQHQDARSYRLSNIDMLRGLVIVIMAIDHVRDGFMMGAVHDVMDQPDVTLSLYLTRWITHFCAPVFVFLAGTSAGLMAARKTPQALGAFLLKRGLWLIFVEIFIIANLVSFSPFGVAEMGGAIIVVLQVIWAIGASMVLLGAAQFMGGKRCLYLGVVILLGHNVLDPLWVGASEESASPWLALLFYQHSFGLGPFAIWEIYPVLAWFGVMLLGFGSAFIFEQESQVRDAQLRRIGMIFIAVFVILRTVGLYGDANGWEVQEYGLVVTVLDFMNVTKYPPSLLFLLATLGPMAIVAGLADRFNGWLKDTLVMFGRVPFLFYLAHFLLIHLLAIALGVLQGFDASQFMTAFMFYPEGYGVSLPGVYAAWLLVLVILYPLCKWFAGVKTRSRSWWLSYL